MNAPIRILIPIMVLAMLTLVDTSSAGASRIFRKTSDKGQQAATDANLRASSQEKPETKRVGVLQALFGKRQNDAAADRRSRDRYRATTTTNTASSRSQTAVPAPSRASERTSDPQRTATATRKREGGGLFAGLFRQRDRRTAARPSSDGASTGGNAVRAVRAVQRLAAG